MVAHQENGRIRLSWSQIIWGIGMLVAVLSSWADLRIHMAQAFEKIEAQERRLTALEARNNGFTQQDAMQLKEAIVDELKRNRDEIKRRK